MKHSFNKIVLASTILLTVMASCRKESEVSDIVNPNNYKVSNSYAKQFEMVWNGMSQGYVFWGRDTVDWDARYEEYKPVFEEFDTRPTKVSQAEYQEAYEGLFRGLLDHHLAGMFCTPKARVEAYVSPGQNDYYHPTYSGFEREMQLEALQRLTNLVAYEACEPADYGIITIPGTYFALIKLRPGQMIAYFRFTNFYLTNIHDYYTALPNQESVQVPLRKFYGSRYWEGVNANSGYANNDSVVGLIIDLRGNGGGSTSDLATFIGSLSQAPTQVGYTRTKSGFGRLDYSPWSPYIIGCPSRHLNSQKPIVVLADINSVSCAELATLLIKNLPNGTFIGERTYGAVGALLPDSEHQHDILYSGCFGDYEYFQYGSEIYRYKDFYPYYVYTSTYHMVDCDYQDIEGVGVQPDIEVLYDRDALVNKHTDNQLNRAIKFLREKTLSSGN